MNDLNFSMDMLAYLWWCAHQRRMEDVVSYHLGGCTHIIEKGTRENPYPRRCRRKGTLRASDGYKYCYQHHPLKKVQLFRSK